MPYLRLVCSPSQQEYLEILGPVIELTGFQKPNSVWTNLENPKEVVMAVFVHSLGLLDF